MIYCPHRSDFELKYFSRDFLAEIVDRTAPLFCLRNLEKLAAKQQIAEDFIAENGVNCGIAESRYDLLA